MSADVTETATFRLDPEVVFDYVVDFSHLAEWDPVFEESRALDDQGGIGPGTRFEVVASVAGQRVPITYTIEEYDRPHSARLVGRGDGFTSIDDMTIESVDEGARLRWQATVETDAAVVDTAATPVFKAVAKSSISGLRDTLGR